MNEDDYMERLQHYINIGAIQEAGIDEDGNVIFEIDEIKTKTLAPELWDAHMEYIDNSYLQMYQDGLIRIEYNEDLEATVHFSEEGYRIAVEKGLIPLNMKEIPDN